MSKQLGVPAEVGVSCEWTHVLVHLGISQNKNLLLPSIYFTLQNVRVKQCQGTVKLELFTGFSQSLR